MNFSAAEAIASQLVMEIVSDPQLLGDLMQSSGVSGADLRRLIDTPDIHPFVMNFAAQSDALLVDLAQRIGAAPQDLAQAAALLGGPGHHLWGDP
ncbi:MAG: DUF3572 family protein [Paracoccus sp. (in: a-proteobacteria)]|nr:DUF3572 family protein [Paracoccus sp. (in: a-proteobacteria)]